MSNFARCLDRVLRHEGGFADHKDDPGGRTMQGVTQATYDGWRRSRGLLVRDVRQIERAELESIYRSNYWNVIRGDELPAGIDYCTFDAAVNSGPSRGARWLQGALGVAVDGRVGPVTIAAAKAASAQDVIEAMCDARMAFLRDLRHWPTFAKGWTRRVNEVEATALDMALSRLEEAKETDMTTETETKPALRSRTIWGGMIAGAGGLVGLLAMLLESFGGVALDAGEQAEITGSVTKAAEGIAAGDWGAVAMAVASLVGGGLAIYGRFAAKARIGK